jgi:hypothetical protein
MKITYLLGAGASAEAIPALDNFNTELRKFVHEIETLQSQLTNTTENVNHADFQKIISSFLEDAAVLLTEIEEHYNADVYARKLYLNNQTGQLRQLKALLSAFVVYVQTLHKPDKRYDRFFANILECDDKGEIQIPNELLLLSWNYDFQMELAAAKFFGEKRLEQLLEILNQHPKQQMNDLDREVLNRFSIIKINGTAAGYFPDENSFIPHPFLFDETFTNNKQHLQKLVQAVLHYHRFAENGSTNLPGIMYAWESNALSKRIRTYTKYKTYNTEVLVVIGYSFPTFNRRVDRELLQTMITLKDVYIQAPSDSINAIAERFYALLGTDKIKGIGNAPNAVNVRLVEMKSPLLDDEFFIPFQATSF